jgi:hypothetical protein
VGDIPDLGAAPQPRRGRLKNRGKSARSEGRKPRPEDAGWPPAVARGNPPQITRDGAHCSARAVAPGRGLRGSYRAAKIES